MELDKTISILFLVLFFPLTEEKLLKQKRDSHIPPLEARTFLRDAVERLPIVQTPSDRSAALIEEFGSRALPLRAAIESVPDLTLSSRRLPLRDAVQKRPSPDEPMEVDDLEGINYIPYRSQSSISSSYQTFYSPLQLFRNIVGLDFIQIPYRIDNRNQQLISYPKVGQARTFHPKSPVFRNLDQSVEHNDYKIVCYVQGVAAYRKEPLTFSPDDLDPFACTHVIYAFASIDPHSFNMISNDDEFDIVQGGYRAVTGLKQANPKLKVLISVGEGREDGSHRFTNMVSSGARRRDFIRSAVTFIEQYGFDGIDIHWQYPGAEELGGNVSDKDHLSSFLAELSKVFKPNGWVLSVAVPASRFRIEDGFHPHTLGNYADFIHLQAYDFHRDREPIADHHANLNSRPQDHGIDLFLSADYSVKFLLKKGLPRSKLLLGIPFFGRSFTLQYNNETNVGAPIKGPGREGFYTQNPGLLGYFEICDMLLNEGWHRNVDESGSPYIVYGDQWVGYDDSESIERKISYIKQMQLGGASIWSSDLDDFKGLCGEKWPLLGLISRRLKGVELRPPSTPAKPYGVCATNGLFSDPKNCAAYYICRSGLSYHLACGDNMMFDSSNGRCDYISPQKCRPGESVYVSNTVRDLDNMLRYEQKEKKPKVVCYITNWAFYRKAEGKFVPEHIDQRLCTHVIYAFASLDTEKLLIKEFDPWADLDNNLYARVTSLKDTKVLLSMGGWTDSAGDKYSRLVSDGSARRRFVIGVVSFLRRHHFAGLHLDWNYPVCWQSNCKKGPASDKPNFTKLIQELRKEFDKQMPSLLLSVSISGYKEVIDVAYDLPNLSKLVEFMAVMTYDYHGSWERQTGHVSPLYHRPGDKYPQYNTNFTMEYLVSRGASREKLLVGIPFYGQSFTLSKTDDYDQGVATVGPGESGDYTKQPGMLAYYEICHRIRNSRWIVNRDGAGATGPFAYYRDQWVGFEDVKSIREKAEYIRTNGFGGAVAWTIDLDDFSNGCCGGSFPLLRSLNRGLRLIPDKPLLENCTKPPEPITPVPPQTTTGIDSGAQSSTEHLEHSTTSMKPPSTWWSPTSQKPTTSWIGSTWWPTPTTTKRTTITTRKPQYTTALITTTRQPITTALPSWATTIPPPAVVMPEVDNPIQNCETGQYLPDPKNCNAFYRCILGELKKQYCAGGLHWNKERNVCDWPNEAKCEIKQHKPNKKPTTSHGETKTTPMTATHTTESYSTSTGSISELVEQCNNGQYYPHESCSSFYICVNGQLVTQNCAPGLDWNVDSSMCDWKYKTKCFNREKIAQKFSDKYKTKTKPQLHSHCDDNDFAAYPDDCTQYMQCLWGTYETYQCAPGLHWNDEKKTCDWPASAKCFEGTPNDDNEIASTQKPSTYHPTTTTSKTTTSGYVEWRPTIPPTSEKPPLAQTLKPHSGYFKIVCYFTNWAWYRRGTGKYLPEDINPDLCTHIVYGFAVLDYENLLVKAHDSWADFDNRFYERVTAYKEKGVKVSLALGGWNDSQGDKYSRLVNNPSARARFIKHVLEFLEKYNFDGLDLDWEYPKCWQVDCKKGPDSDKEAFSAWVRELKQAFQPKGYLLSAAVSPSKVVIDAGYDVPVLADNLDWVAVMTYDFHGQWDKQTGHVAPLYYHPEDEVAYYNANYSINYWISEGVPRRKIVMGMPLYGQSFQLANEMNHDLNAKAPGPGQQGQFTGAAGFLAYYEICDNVKNRGWSVVQDPKRRLGPYAYKGNQWVSFDDQEMIRLKSEYIRKMDLGGGMIWALDLDDFRNSCGEGAHPLLATIRNVLADSASDTPVTEAVKVENESETYPIGHHTTIASIIDQTTPPHVNLLSEYKVVCYFTNWAWYRQGKGKYLPADIDPDLCTHIIYGFAVLNGDQLIIKPHDTWADFDNKFYEKVTALKAKGIKVLIAIGGWNDSAGDKYSKLVNNPSARRRFIAHVVDFIEANNFDGLDLDWEYPKCWQVDCNKGPSSDKSAFAAFIKELHSAFQPKGWLLSSAVSPSRRVIDAGYDIPTLSKYLDWIAVMCYDYHGQWDKITGHVAPMYAHPDDVDATFNTNFTINYWIENGADRKKLVMGMPMYGQSFSLADVHQTGLNAPTYGGGEAGEETRARGFLAYYEICTNVINKGWSVERDRKGRIGPYAYLKDQWVSFDDIGMIRHKSEYIKAMNLGGGMIWALDLDDFKNLCGCEEYPLLRTINRVLRNYTRPDPKCILGRTKPTQTTPSIPSSTTTISEQPITAPPPPVETQKPVTHPTQSLPCFGYLFMAAKNNCNQYYMCNQGQLELQTCPNGLYWNQDRCDWPENTPCHPDSTTITPPPSMSANESEWSSLAPVSPTIQPTTGGIDAVTSNQDYKVICYFTNWAWYRRDNGKYQPQDISPTLCTHINYAFAVLDATSLTIKPHDSWADIDNHFYKNVIAYKTKGIKVLIALGGWNDSNDNKYSRLVNDPQARTRFIAHLVEFIEKWGFDGLDLDWEYPKCWQVDCNKGPDSDKDGFADLVVELSRTFKPKGLLLSAAVSPSKAVIDAAYNVPVLAQHFDWIAIMTYDFHGNWDKQTGHVAPLYYYPGDVYDYFNSNFSINYWIEKGAAPSKLVMGLPFYGQTFTLADASKKGLNAKSYGPGEAGEFTGARGFLAFYEICERVKRRGWQVTRDSQGRIGPYATMNNQWVSYDDIAEIRRKSKLIKQLGLGGGMVWALDLDDFNNVCGCGDHPLLETLNNELRGTPSSIELQNCT